MHSILIQICDVVKVWGGYVVVAASKESKKVPFPLLCYSIKYYCISKVLEMMTLIESTATKPFCCSLLIHFSFIM
jgi:hypothetical protein